MAVNKPIGDDARKGAVKKRPQLKNALTKTPTNHNKEGGEFMAFKKSAKNPRVSGKRSNGQVFYRDSYRELQPHFCALPLRSVGGLIENFDLDAHTVEGFQ
jgi:hypothetical protein